MDQRLELDLELDSDGHGGFRVTVRSAAGEAAGVLRLDPRPLLAQRPALQSTVLASAVTSRGGTAETEGPVRSVGQELFRALFDDDVYGTYRASLAVAAERGTQLRVVLRTQLPELAALPWEMLFDPDTDAYLCQREPLVRHVAVHSATRALRVSPPLRILGVVSAPRDKARLDVEGEKQRLAAALRPLGSRVELRWVDGGRWADVQQELVAGSWHVLHFVGHGGFDAVRREGVLVLEDEDGGSDLVGADRFGDLLTLQVPPLQLVLLNSCAGGQSAADDLFSSTAATLVRTGVSAVVAMQFAVSDPAAKAFAAGFYQAIAHNHSIAEAVRIGRIGIRGTGEQTLEWITPVLYLRGDDAPLFEVLPGSGDTRIDQALAPVDAAHEVAVQALYQQAMSRFRAGNHAEALPLFDSVLSLRADYRDAADRRERSAHEVRVVETLQEGHDAEERGDWSAAAASYCDVLALDPDRAGVAERLEGCRRREQVTVLREELREHLGAEDWTAAASVADDLERLAPGEPDPDGLVARARAGSADEETTPAEVGPSEDVWVDDDQADDDRAEDGPTEEGHVEEEHVEEHERRRLLPWVGAAVALLLVGVGLWVWLGPDGGTDGTDGASGDVPAPFASTSLWELASPYFDPDECFVPQTENDALLLWDLPHTELVLCIGSDYKSSFVCVEDRAGLVEVRTTLVTNRAQEEPVALTVLPAGRDEPWPYQVSFVDRVFDGGRVYWEDSVSRCAAILRVEDPDVDLATAYFRDGLGG